MSYQEQIKYIKNKIKENLPITKLGKDYKFSFGPALPFLYESECEYVEIFLNKRMNKEEIDKLLNENEKFILQEVKTVPLFFPSLDSSTEIIEYEISLKEEINIEKLKEELNKEEIIYETIDKKNDLQKINIKDYYYDFEYFEKEKRIKLFIKYKLGKTIKPDIFLKVILKVEETKQIIRKNIFWIDSLNCMHKI